MQTGAFLNPPITCISGELLMKCLLFLFMHDFSFPLLVSWLSWRILQPRWPCSLVKPTTWLDLGMRKSWNSCRRKHTAGQQSTALSLHERQYLKWRSQVSAWAKSSPWEDLSLMPADGIQLDPECNSSSSRGGGGRLEQCISTRPVLYLNSYLCGRIQDCFLTLPERLAVYPVPWLLWTPCNWSLAWTEQLVFPPTIRA